MDRRTVHCRSGHHPETSHDPSPFRLPARSPFALHRAGTAEARTPSAIIVAVADPTPTAPVPLGVQTNASVPAIPAGPNTYGAGHKLCSKWVAAKPKPDQIGVGPTEGVGRRSGAPGRTLQVERRRSEPVQGSRDRE